MGRNLLYAVGLFGRVYYGAEIDSVGLVLDTKMGLLDDSDASSRVHHKHYLEYVRQPARRIRQAVTSVHLPLLNGRLRHTVMYYKYVAYGLNILSYVPLPELEEAAFDDADLTVSAGALTPPESEFLPEGEGCWSATEEEAHYFWSNVGGIRIRNGREITCHPNPETTETTLRLSLLGPVLATALHQRGFLVLHASAVLTENGAVAFVGPSGSGKTTSLSAIISPRNQHLTDDLLVLSPEEEPVPLVVPGPPYVKVWPEVVSAQGRDPSALPTLGPGYFKLVDRKARGALSDRIPLHRIYLVVPDETLEIKAIRQSEALMALMTHSYCSEVLRFTGESRNFEQCAAVVRKVPVRELRRGQSLANLTELASIVERDLG